MIGTLVRVGWLNLKRDRAAQAMTFLLPIIFFSIFASVFGNQGGDAMSSVRVAVVDEDRTAASARLVSAIQKEDALRLRTTMEPASEGVPGVPLDRGRAEALIRAGDIPIAIVIPAGTGQTIATTGLSSVTLTLLVDPSDPVASQVVQGLVQKAVMTSSPQASAAMAGLGVDVVNVLGGGDGEETDLVAFYAAGIGVMFLLFSCSSAGGSLIDEVDSGTLERLIGSRAGMTGVLAGKWIFIMMLGFLQLTVMFVWGALVFGLDLWSHIPGFIVMSAFSAAAAAALGLLLATASRTRAQLSGMSTILILTMSALGGSMFPRFLMSETMQRMGLVTFNAWALDGYLKVFWRELPLSALAPQLAVLAVMTIVFLLAARIMARKWETV